MASTLHLKLPAGLPVVFISLCLFLNSCENSQQNLDHGFPPTKGEPVGKNRNSFKKWIDSNVQSQGTYRTITIDSAHRAGISRMYAQHHYEPLWLQKNGQAPLSDQWIQVLQDIHGDGLDSAAYYIRQIRRLQRIIKSGRSLPDSSAFSLELLLTASFFKLSTDMISGTHPERIIRKEWKNRNDSIIVPGPILIQAIERGRLAEAIHSLRPQLPQYDAFRKEYARLWQIQQSGGWPLIQDHSDSTVRADEPTHIRRLRKRLQREIGIPVDTLNPLWSNDLEEAIKRFQYLNHLKTNGKLDSNTIQKLNINVKQKLQILALNMERLRWMSRTFDQPYIWVNVPQMELNLVDHDSVIYSMRVVVGRPSRPTIMLDAKLLNIVFSPPWTIPPTIMKEEVIPGIARRGASYLSRRGLKAYDLNGKQVSPLHITKSNFTQFRVGQAPGYNSSLGEVKFNLLNPWSIYLHDTPHREDFIKRNRALSSGCIRVHHPKEFAELLLADSINYTLSKIDSICGTRKTKFVTPRQTYMVHIVYLTNATDSAGNMIYLKDIYHWDKTN